MLIVGSPVVGDGARFKEITLPSLERLLDHDDVILTSTGDVRGIAAVYNDFLREARARSECQTLVLLHDDVEIVDHNFRAKILAAVSEERVGVVGTAGGADLRSAGWWAGRFVAGQVFESRGSIHPGPPRADVDVVDGLLMAVAPRAFHLSFDEETCPRFHGYDVDFCLQARAAGLRVTVRPIDVLHRTKGGFGDWDAYSGSAAALAAKWPEFIRPPTLQERIRTVPKRVGTVLRTQEQRLRRLVRLPDPAQEPRGAEVVPPAPEDSVARARKRLEWLQLYLSEGTVLEIGCGSGDFLRVAESEGYDVFGVEPDAEASERSRTVGLPVETGQLSDWQARYPGLRPDGVCLWGTLPGSGPVELLRQVLLILAPGGHLFIEVHQGFTPDGLADVITQAGFEVLHLLPTTGRIYESRISWRKQRNAALVSRAAWPPLDVIRCIARSTST